MIPDYVSPLHLAGCIALAIGGTMTHICALKGSWRWALMGSVLTTTGGVALLFAPSMFREKAPQ